MLSSYSKITATAKANFKPSDIPLLDPESIEKVLRSYFSFPRNGVSRANNQRLSRAREFIASKFQDAAIDNRAEYETFTFDTFSPVITDYDGTTVGSKSIFLSR